MTTVVNLAGCLAMQGQRVLVVDLGRAVEGLKAEQEFVLVDCPLNVGLLTFNALRAAQEAIVPLETSYFALRGVFSSFCPTVG